MQPPPAPAAAPVRTTRVHPLLRQWMKRGALGLRDVQVTDLRDGVAVGILVPNQRQ